MGGGRFVCKPRIKQERQLEVGQISDGNLDQPGWTGYGAYEAHGSRILIRLGGVVLAGA